jgi:hypothetical protein
MWAHPDLALRGSNGWTALHYAAQCEYGKSVVESLLLRDTDVNVRDNARLAPLDHALARNPTKMAVDRRQRMTPLWSGISTHKSLTINVWGVKRLAILPPLWRVALGRACAGIQFCDWRPARH